MIFQALRNIFIFIVFLFGLPGLAQTISFPKKAQQLIGNFAAHHPNPFQPGEKTSLEIVDIFVSGLDNTAIVLKQDDIAALKKNGGLLFEQIGAHNDDYMRAAGQVYLKALNCLDSLLFVIWANPIDFAENDTLTFLPYSAKTQYSPDIKSHARRIKRYIKYKACEKVSNTETFASLGEKEFIAKAQEFSKGITERLRKNVKEQINNASTTLEYTLLNAIAQRYDPHSNYFNEEQNKEFNQQLSSTVESYGFRLDENDDGNVHVSVIDPGGSAWLSNDVNEGDLFVSVKIGAALVANGEATADEIQTKIDNSPEKNIVLTIKKPNGPVKKVKLVKQKTGSETNNVKGYLLEKDNVQIGYISLPSFYTDMEGHHLPGCANDVAKEILKLEQDSIQGLIIDLRNNGGGSMQEAMNLAGIFIDEGPLFIYRERNKKPVLVKDLNRGSIFKKPIVIMINETSASASELFSNIIKDYQLGVIVGQISYGKGTAQNVVPLDSTLSKLPAALKTNKDFLKMTTGKFYRLNCSTHQGQGVIPDIELPSFAGYSNYKENKESYYLLPDSVNKKIVYSPRSAIEISTLRKGSKERVARSKEFRRYVEVSDSLSARLNSSQKVPLKFADYKRYKSQTDAGYLAYENAASARLELRCRNNTFDKDLNEINPQVKEFNSKVLKSIEEDIFISESFEIMKDLLHQ